MGIIMGSLPTQGTDSGFFPITTSDEAISVTTTYTNKLEIDSRNIKDSVITISNEDATATLSYKIYASPKDNATIPADSDDSWINIIRPIGGSPDDADPSTYDHNRSKTIPALGLHYESFSNKWSWVRIQMQSSSGTITAKAWHRGTP